MNEDLAKKIDKEIADKVKPPKPRRVKPRRKTKRVL
jgi:hypothetical protein